MKFGLLFLNGSYQRIDFSTYMDWLRALNGNAHLLYGAYIDENGNKTVVKRNEDIMITILWNEENTN